MKLRKRAFVRVKGWTEYGGVLPAGDLLVLSGDGLAAVDADSLAVRWVAANSAEPACVQGAVLIASGSTFGSHLQSLAVAVDEKRPAHPSATLFAFDIQSGELLWQRDSFRGKHWHYGDELVIQSADGRHLEFLGHSDGAVCRALAVPLPVAHQVDGEIIVMSGRDDLVFESDPIAGVRLHDGRVVWRRNLEAELEQRLEARPVHLGSARGMRIYQAGATVAAVRVRDGEVAWTAEFPDKCHPELVADGRVLGGGRRGVAWLSVADGKPGFVPSHPSGRANSEEMSQVIGTYQGLIVVRPNVERLRLIDPLVGSAGTFAVPRNNASQAVDVGRMLLLLEDERIIALEPAPGPGAWA